MVIGSTSPNIVFNNEQKEESGKYVQHHQTHPGIITTTNVVQTWGQSLSDNADMERYSLPVIEDYL